MSCSDLGTPNCPLMSLASRRVWRDFDVANLKLSRPNVLRRLVQCEPAWGFFRHPEYFHADRAFVNDLPTPAPAARRNLGG